MSIIYHITGKDTWSEAVEREVYDYCSLKTDGFIHCSTKEQCVKTANAHFKGREDLVVLELDSTKLSARVVFENLEGGTEKFPHVYGKLELDAVTGFYEFEISNDKTFVIMLELKRRF